jgi:hypothetical protein
MTIPNSAIKYGLGVTYIDNAGTWDPLKGMWIYNADNTWHPVKTGWVAHNDGTWERIYPTPKGIFNPSTTSLGHSYYQNFPDTGSTLVVTNTGDYDLTINNVVYNDSVGNYATNGPSFPVTITPGSSTPLTFYVTGNILGTYSGNIQFTNYIGYFGYANATINQSVTVIPDYAAISIPSGTPSVSTYLNESGSATVTIQNIGNGANLTIASIASQNGYFTASGFTSGNIIPGSSAQFYVNSVSTLSAGEYVDFAIVSSNANNSAPIKVNITVTQLNGLQLFTTPGTYYWTVPAHLHKINYLAVGGGGSGGSGVGNYGGGGGGGGSGGYQESTSVTVTPGETITVVVGDSGDSPTVVGQTTVYPVSDPGAWCSFLNTYGVWVNPNGVDPVGQYQNMTRAWTAPYTGTYAITASADNLVQVFIDEVLLTQSDDYTTTVTTNFSATQGDHKVFLNMLNQGGPAGVAVTIVYNPGPGSILVWSTRTQLNSGLGNAGENTTISGSFGTVAINGGGAGGGATQNPPSYGDSGGSGDGPGDGGGSDA